jgi:gliding motility-associated-like protein
VPDPILTVPDDPCLLGIVGNTNLNELNDMFWINSYPAGTFTNNVVYFVPVTMYSLTNAPPIYSYVNTSMPCYETGNIYSVQYIPEITEVSVVDCTAGTVTTTVTGGEPSMNGSVFTGTNLIPATASFAPGTATNGGDIVVTGLVDGDVYSYDIVDASGCPITVTGTFIGLDDPAFTYPQTAYCQDAANPSPTIMGDVGGTFSSTVGLSITPGTGQINLAASTPGTYTITYQTPDPICFATSTFTLTINPLPIVDGNDETICAGGSVTLNGTGADTYVWNNGVTDGVAFSPTGTTTYTVTGTITATGCVNTGTATVTVAPMDDPSFTTTNYCEGGASPVPIVIGLAGGTFALNPAPVGPTINASTGIITGGVGGATYTVEYTTNGVCPQTSTQTITVYALPTVDAQDVSVCIGGTVAITATGAVTYSWDNGLGAGQSHNVTPAVNTTYVVTGTDANGCVNTDVMTVSILANAPIDAGADVTICEGDMTTLTATGGVSYMWLAPISAAGSVQNVSPLVTTTYIVNGTDAAGCTGTDQVIVTVNPLPTATISGTVTICQNDASPTVIFTGANGTAPYTFTYTINGGANQTVVSVGSTATLTAPTGTVGTFDYDLVSVASATGCSQAQVDQATITVSPLPTASVAGTITVCQNDAVPTITFTGANGTAPYTFTYNINGGANQTVVSAGTTATVTAPIGIVGTFNYNLVSVSEASATGCSQAQIDQATVTVSPLPTASIAGTIAVCENDGAPTVTFTGANGTAPYTFTYNINGGANQTVVSVGTTAAITAPTGIVGTFNYNLVSVSEASATGCSQVQAGTATITVNPNPVPVINGAAQYCAGTTSTLFTTVPYATYAWSTGSTNPTVNVTSADNPITVTVTNAEGCSATSAIFTVIENNIIVYNTTVEICEGFTATIHGNVESVSGMYSQTFILATGCDSTSNVNLIINPFPIIDAGADQVLCEATPVTLSASGAPNIVWDNSATNGVPFSQAVGTITYTATGTDANGCIGSDMVDVTIIPLPTATIAGAITVCQNDPSPTITFTGANGTAPYTFTYNINGGTNQTITSVGAIATITAPTGTVGIDDYNLVSVSESSATGCAQAQAGTAAVTVNELPTATISGTATVCQNDAGPIITFTGANGTAPYTFTYNINGGANQTVTSVGLTATVIAPTGTVGTFDYNLVSVTESIATGCSQAQVGVATITVSPLPTATIAGTVSVCQNDASPIITFTGANGTAPYTFTYAINGGANQTVVSVGSTATVTAPTGTVGTFDYNLVSVAGTTGCSQAQIDQATITVTPNPTATISGTIAVCLGDASPTITLTGANGTAPYTFTYNVNNTGDVTINSVGDIATIIVPTSVAGVFDFNLVSVSDASATGCSQAQVGTATVTVNDLPVVFAGNDFTICDSEQALLTGSGASGYVWDQGVVDGVLFMPLTTATYTLTGTDANGCVNTDDVVITIETAPVVSFIGDNLSGCVPLTVTFTNTTPGLLDNCVWTLENGTVLNGCGSVTTTFTTPGLYNVTLTTTSITGCVASATYTDYIYVEADPIASFLPSSTMISNINPEIYLENTSTGAVDYDWDFGDGSPIVHVESPTYQFPDNEPGTYDVELIAYSPLGCNDTAYATIQVTEEVIFYVPNTFTPDDDDHNPTFQPVFSSGYDPFDFTLLIFNRWGEIIFESHNADIGWDGTYGEGRSLAQDGAYTWKIEFKTTASDERKVVVGHVNMMK